MQNDVHPKYAYAIIHTETDIVPQDYPYLSEKPWLWLLGSRKEVASNLAFGILTWKKKMEVC
jgi:hypothetical protein